MKKERELNLAQVVIITLIANACDDDDEIGLRVETWLANHPVICGILYALIQIPNALINIVQGFKRPADSSLELAHNFIEAAELTNEACKPEEA